MLSNGYAVDGNTIVLAGRHLTSRTNRKAEAALQASTVAVESEEAWVYGWGLGDIQRELLSRPALKRLFVVPLCHSIVEAACDFEPQEWLRDPRVKVIEAAEEVVIPFAVYPADLRMADRVMWRLRDRIMAVVNHPFNAFLFQQLQVLWSSHLADNKWCLDTDPSVSSLFGTDTRPAIVIGGGPTVSLAYDWIKRQDMNVIAASTALGPLLAAGISPDVTVVIDRAPAIARHFVGDCTGSLVYDPQVHPSVTKSWKGRRFVVRNELFSGGSVIHNQIDIAVRMGAREVYLVGLDFGYPNRTSHVAGAPQPYNVSASVGQCSTMNGRSEEITTDPNLLQYRVCAEEFVALHPEVKWRKLGREGSEMRDVEWFDAV